jgi:kynurenine formamidase
METTPAYTFESTEGVFQANYYTLSGQYATHIDFPRHFDPNGKFQHEFGLLDMAWPLVVFDASAQVAANPDYELTPADVLAWEAANGKVPEGCFAAMRSDWYKRPAAQFDNVDSEGQGHYPGWSMEALKLLIEERNVAVIGHETPDTDAAVPGTASNMACEGYVLKSGKLNVELLARLDQLPPAGAIVFMPFPNLKDGVGFNSRVFAICPR